MTNNRLLNDFQTATEIRAGRQAEPALAWDFGELESPLWPVAEAAYRLLTGPDLQRLKRCAGCPWLLLDQSKNGAAAGARWRTAAPTRRSAGT